MKKLILFSILLACGTVFEVQAQRFDLLPVLDTVTGDDYFIGVDSSGSEPRARKIFPDTLANWLDLRGYGFQFITGIGGTADGTKFLRDDGTWASVGAGLTQEEVEDFTGGMVSTNTETGITVTYDDAGGKLDFVAEVTQAEVDAKQDAAAAATDAELATHEGNANAHHTPPPDCEGSACTLAAGTTLNGAAIQTGAEDDQPDDDSEVPNAITVDISGAGNVTGGTATRCARFDGSGNLVPATGDCPDGDTGGGGGLSNAYASVTDGTVTATASGGDTFKFRAANNLLTIAVQNDDATHGDNALFTINQANLSITESQISDFGTYQAQDADLTDLADAAYSGLFRANVYGSTHQTLSGTTPTWNVTNGSWASITLSANTAITLSNMPSDASLWLRVTNGASHTLSINATPVDVHPSTYNSGVTHVNVTNTNGTLEYFSTAEKVDLANDVTGTLPEGNVAAAITRDSEWANEATFEANAFAVVVPGENNDTADDLSDDNVSALSDVDGKHGDDQTLATVSGATTGGNCAQWDATGDLVDSGGVCGGGGGVTDGDKGDVTVSGSGAVWNVDAGVIGPTELDLTGSYAFTGTVTLDDLLYGTQALTCSGAAPAWDVTGGPIAYCTASAGINIDVTITGHAEGGVYQFIYTQDADGGQTVALNGTSVPVYSGANDATIITAEYVNGAWHYTGALTESDISDLAHSPDLTVDGAGTLHANNLPSAATTDSGMETLTNKTMAAGSNTFSGFPYDICAAASDETTDLTTGVAKVVFRVPRAFTLTDVRASVNTAPTGSTLNVDINEGGTSVLSTVITIDASEETSTTAATSPVISDSAIADDAEITVDIDQVGSTAAGKGLKVCMIGTVDI